NRRPGATRGAAHPRCLRAGRRGRPRCCASPARSAARDQRGGAGGRASCGRAIRRVPAPAWRAVPPTASGRRTSRPALPARPRRRICPGRSAWRNGNYGDARGFAMGRDFAVEVTPGNRRTRSAMPRFRTTDDLDVAGKRVLVRADLNVPVKDGKVTDATRIERLVPTIEALLRKGARVVVMSHFGRPKGPDPALSLRPLVEPLSRAIGGKKVHFAPDCVGPEAKRVVDALKPGGVALLENLRFHPEEEKNDPGFAKQLAELGDAYVDDAFSAAHRAHASIEALAHL